MPVRDAVEFAFAFNSRHRSHTNQSVLKAWNRYRDPAGVDGRVTVGSIRDASFTVACRVSLD